MSTKKVVGRWLGVAFLLQFATSFSSGVFISRALIVEEDIQETMRRIAAAPGLMQTQILLDMATAFGIVFLGAALYLVVRNAGRVAALTGFGLYTLEASILAAARIPAYILLRVSQDYAAAGQPPDLLRVGSLALGAMEFSDGALHMLAFCVGGTLFYALLFRSRAIPWPLSMWGLIAILPCLAGTLLKIIGIEMPFIFYFPYVPFELVVGLWILIRGVTIHEVVPADVVV